MKLVGPPQPTGALWLYGCIVLKQAHLRLPVILLKTPTHACCCCRCLSCREVLRPQPLFDYDKGGVPNSVYWKLLPGLKSSNPGFEMCIAVRHKDYKWLGATGKVYRCGDAGLPGSGSRMHT